MKRRAVAQLKGGVGKSTTTLFLAEHWAMRGKRILVIDLDPQASVSFMLLSSHGMTNAVLEHKTLPQLFEDERKNEQRDALSYIHSRASDLVQLRHPSPGYVSIVPCVPKMWLQQFDFDRDCYRRGVEPVDEIAAILERFLNQVEMHYDCVLFDCPPGFNSLTRAAIRLSPEGIFAPTIADQVSMQSLKEFVDLGLQQTMQFPWRQRMFVVVSKYTNTIQQQTNLDPLRRNYTVISPPIPMRDQVQIASEYLAGRQRQYSAKYGRPLLRPIGTEVKRMTDALFSATFP